MSDKRDEILEIENAQLLFLNFRGAAGKYNREGDRNFCVKIDEHMVEPLRNDRWLVKRLKPRDDEEQGQAYLEVAVKFGNTRPPRILLCSSRSRTPLDESLCEMVDYVDINHVDLVIRGYDWEVNGNSGRKAYLKNIYVVVTEDRFEHKYADLELVSLDGSPAALPAAEEQRALPASDNVVLEGEWR